MAARRAHEQHLDFRVRLVTRLRRRVHSSDRRRAPTHRHRPNRRSRGVLLAHRLGARCEPFEWPWAVEALVSTVMNVLDGAPLDRSQERLPLSRRELEVLRMTAQGMTNPAIARELSVSVHAIKFHLASIYRKLGVANRTEAAVAFLQPGRWA